ncbi:TetR/AcrR family transcriptional regulator [Streptantibioticus silvisoli]|uniref:TetR/AcrR family transcriptional regulator n=1 Tax=Streptantibioticus silvisoli TaxID=2705255 RepID=A0ABT6W7N8_9ACTN|nr:TetR/AcrR family transcriptional regulator [Streptantibioticus silvisoli]MDI5966764.1 TetR/AcrR family transcriptional regulator [Streptantibioticus silvisoli]
MAARGMREEGGVGVERVTRAPGAGTVGAPRGRPRSERARAAVLEAAADLLVDGGMDAVTMEAIAARAKVSKATVYKWWPSRAHVMLESFFSRTRETTEVPEGLSLEESLTSLVAALARLVRDTTGGALLGDLIAAAQSDPDIRAALDERWVRPRRQASAGLLRAAVERGELTPGLDVAAAVDQLFAPVYYRLLLGHEPLADDLAATLVRQLLGGLRPPRPPRS